MAANSLEDEKTVHTWVVDKFSTLTQANYHSYSSFNIKNSNVQCQIELYPMGSSSFWSNYSIVFVWITSVVEEKFNCKLSILKSNGDEWVTTEGVISRKNLGRDTTFKFNFLNPEMKIYRQNILNEKDLVLPNDKLTIRCEMWPFLESNSAIELPIQKDFASLIQDPLFSDVTCQVSGKEFRLHKAILASRSPYFKAMFTNNLEEAKSGKFKVPDISVDAFEEALKFIYSEKIPDLKEFGLELFEFADKYQMKQLKNLCEKSLGTKLDNDSVIATLLLADLHSAAQLKSKCLDFIKTNSQTIQQHEHWKELKKNQKLLIDLYKTIELTVETVIEALLLADSHEDSDLKDKCIQFMKKNLGNVKKQSALKALKKDNPELLMELLMELLPDN